MFRTVRLKDAVNLLQRLLVREPMKRLHEILSPAKPLHVHYSGTNIKYNRGGSPS